MVFRAVGVGELVENDRRLIRQRLIALEQGRSVDARLIGAYLVVQRKLALFDARLETRGAEWRAIWKLPDEGFCTILHDTGEGIARIPDGEAGGIGPLERPLTLPLHLEGSIDWGDGRGTSIECRVNSVRRRFFRLAMFDDY